MPRFRLEPQPGRTEIAIAAFSDRPQPRLGRFTAALAVHLDCRAECKVRPVSPVLRGARRQRQAVVERGFAVRECGQYVRERVQLVEQVVAQLWANTQPMHSERRFGTAGLRAAFAVVPKSDGRYGKALEAQHRATHPETHLREFIRSGKRIEALVRNFGHAGAERGLDVRLVRTEGLGSCA